MELHLKALELRSGTEAKAEFRITEARFLGPARPTESVSLGEGPRILYFNKLPVWFLDSLKLSYNVEGTILVGITWWQASGRKSKNTVELLRAWTWSVAGLMRRVESF